jgi:hypothetical protein
VNPNIDFDDYGEVVNGVLTYNAVAQHLNHGASALLGWSDGHGTHLDILLVTKPFPAGPKSRGLEASDLFVSVMSFGAFGFEINAPVTHHGYIATKLGIDPCVTTECLAELINGIKERLHELG